jgi:cytochrome b6-f complex iron-sulfur subunit
MNLNRRKLLSWFGLGWLVTIMPSYLTGCTEAKNSEVASIPSNSFKVIGTVAELDKTGNLLSSDKKVAVIRDPQNANKLLAVNPTCTHQGCTVEWKPVNKAFVCPCHEAQFAADGTVLRKGPAEKPLQQYAAKIENGQILVNVSSV